MVKITKRLFCILSVLFFVCAVFVCLQTPFVAIFNMPSTINLSLDEIANISKFNQFGNFVTLETTGTTTTMVGGQSDLKVKVKLFDFLR